MIRIQIYCSECKQYVDANVYARKGRVIAAAFEDAHTLESCLKEETSGQDEEGAGGGAAAPGAAEAPETAGPEAARERTH